VDILNVGGEVMFEDFYKSDKVTNPHAKTWDGKDDKGVIVPDGVYTIKIVITDMAGNSIIDTSKNIAVGIVL
jgi:flagellar hook assembly protein FlgD